MAKTVLNITEETKGSDLVVLDMQSLITIRNLADSIYNQMDCLRDLMKAAGLPSYSFERDNTVRAYAEQLKVIKTDE
jgi:ribosomal silencing factor RsfS